MADAPQDILHVNGLVTGYGKKQVVNGVSLYVSTGEIVALVGHNGAGKSSLLKAIFGLLPIWDGQVLLEGRSFHPHTPRQLLDAGIAYVPQGNRVFGDLTVLENINIAGTSSPGGKMPFSHAERIFNLFPSLRAHSHQRAGTLSGGEKQMLALASALVRSPRVLLLDEPSLGLAPSLFSEVIAQIQHISHDNNVSIVVVEQKVREVLKIAQRVYVLRNGRVSFTGAAHEVSDNEKLREVYL